MPLLNIRGTLVDFPFEPYDCQMVYMEKVIQALQEDTNALLESPTGTGKTLCLLCAVLGWRRQLAEKQSLERKAKNDPLHEVRKEFGVETDLVSSSFQLNVPRVVYASRTHSQLSGVIKELKKTSYRPSIAILGSRQQMCIHPRVSEYEGVRQNSECRKTVQNRGCSFFNNAEKSSQGGSQGVMDIEDLIAFGRETEVCPFYHSRASAKNAEVVLLPYNYLVDPKIRGSLGVDMRGAVLIFDEAHNLSRVCAEAASIDLSAKDLAQCIEEVSRCIRHAQDPDQVAQSHLVAPGTAQTLHGNFLKLKELLLDLEEKVQHIKLPPGEESVVEDGEFIYLLLQTVGITLGTKTIFVDMVQKAVDLVEGLNEMQGGAGRARNCRLRHLIECIGVIFPQNVESELNQKERKFKKTILRVEKSNKPKSGRKTSNFFSSGNVSSHHGPQKVLSYWAFDSGLAMKSIQNMGVKSILLTSGTLSPMDALVFDMKLDFPIRLENPHVIKTEQIWIGVLQKGPAGRELNSSYKNRTSPNYQNGLGQSLKNIAKSIPDGILVFFPSYAALDSMVTAWNRRTSANGKSIIEQIDMFKHIVIEPKHSSEYGNAIASFREKVADPSKKGAILFAVCRGKSSEGVDFSSRQCRAVFVAGIPYPNFGSLRVKLKRKLLDQYSSMSNMSGEQWYRYQAACAVNQAIGRVIRHKDDFGAIILCDNRFARPVMHKTLCSWLRPYLHIHSNFSHCKKSLSTFFRNTVALGFDSKSRIGSVEIKRERRSGKRQAEHGKENQRTPSHSSSTQRRILKEDFRAFNRIRRAGGGTGGSLTRRNSNDTVISRSLSSMSTHKKAAPKLGLATAILQQRSKAEVISNSNPSDSTAEAGLNYVPLAQRSSSEGSSSLSQRLIKKRQLQLAQKGSSSSFESRASLHAKLLESRNKRRRQPVNTGVSKPRTKGRSGSELFSKLKQMLSSEEFKVFKVFMTTLNGAKSDSSKEDLLATTLSEINPIFAKTEQRRQLWREIVGRLDSKLVKRLRLLEKFSEGA